MKAVNTYIVLSYTSGLHSNFARYRFAVGAKTPEEAEEITKGWLKENCLTARTRPPRTYFLDKTQNLKYKEIRVQSNGVLLTEN